jgi:hypothetical protein
VRECSEHGPPARDRDDRGWCGCDGAPDGETPAAPLLPLFLACSYLLPAKHGHTRVSAVLIAVHQK